MTQNAEVTTPKLTFIDRDNAVWTVDEGTLDADTPVLRLKVVEADGIPTQVVFHKDDAAFIAMLIEEASK